MRRALISGFGIAALCVAGLPAQAAVNLVNNGNFGTGDFTGWSASDASVQIDATFPPAADTYDAQFTGNGVLSQILSTVAGQPYTLSFSLLDESALFSDNFTVTFGGFSTTITGDSAGSYASEALAIPGADITSTSTTLSFAATNPKTAWNLDDVSVTQTAIPEAPAGAILGVAVLMMLSLRQRGRMGRHQV